MPIVYSIGTGLPPPLGSGSLDLYLDPVQQLGYEQVPVWDGPTYLYTINRLHFRGIYNPANSAWNFAHQEPLGGNYTGDYPVQSPGSPPADTNVAIRHFLMQPRGTLTYNIGGTIQTIPGGGNVVVVGGRNDIICPTTIPGADDNDAPAQYTMDAHNGPIPLHCNVIEVRGQKTYIVDWAIEFYVNEAYIFRKSTTLSALLSQRWTVEEDLDQDFFATRTITGHAIFRSDRLQVLNAVADDFRAWLSHPLQNNFARAVQQIVISEDGTRLDYVLVDKEKPFNLGPSIVGAQVTRIEAYYTQGYSRAAGAEDTTFRAIGLIGNAGINIAQARPGSTYTAGLNPAINAMNLGLDMLPRYHQNLVVKVWGKRNSNRFVLANVALQIFFAKNSASITLQTGTIQITEDLMGKFVELNVNAMSGPIQGTIALGNTVFLASPVVGPDEIDGVTQNLAFLQPLPPLDHGTRSNLYSAVNQVLTGADDTTPPPNNNRQYNSLTPQGSGF